MVLNPQRSITLASKWARLFSRHPAFSEFVTVLESAPTERWPSGRRRTPGKCVYGNVSRVRIPPSPPLIGSKRARSISKTALIGCLDAYKTPHSSRFLIRVLICSLFWCPSRCCGQCAIYDPRLSRVAHLCRLLVRRCRLPGVFIGQVRFSWVAFKTTMLAAALLLNQSI